MTISLPAEQLLFGPEAEAAARQRSPEVWETIRKKLLRKLSQHKFHNAVWIFPTADSLGNIDFLQNVSDLPTFLFHYRQLKSELRLQCRCTLFRQVLDQILGNLPEDAFTGLSLAQKLEAKDMTKRAAAHLTDGLAAYSDLYDNFHRALDWYLVLGGYPMLRGRGSPHGEPAVVVPRFSQVFVFYDCLLDDYLTAVYRIDRHLVLEADEEAGFFFFDVPKRESANGQRLVGPLSDLVAVHERLRQRIALRDRVVADNAKCRLVVAEQRPAAGDNGPGFGHNDAQKKEFASLNRDPKELQDFLRAATRNIGGGADRTGGGETGSGPSSFASHFEAWFQQQLESRISGPPVDTEMLKKTVKQMNAVIERQHKALDKAHKDLESSLGREQDLSGDRDALRSKLEGLTEKYRHWAHRPSDGRRARATSPLPLAITRVPANTKYLNAKLHGELPEADTSHFEACCRTTLSTAFYLVRKFTAQGTHVDMVVSNRTVCSVVIPFLKACLAPGEGQRGGRLLLDGTLCSSLPPEADREGAPADVFQTVFEEAYLHSVAGRLELVEAEGHDKCRSTLSATIK